MDIQLPELNGYEATKQIKQKRPALPVLVITANTISDERVHAEKAGCDGFIQKPINFKHFTETIQKLLSVQ